MKNKITPFLWFNSELEEAMDFYTSIFKNSKVTKKFGATGNIMSAIFELEGQEFMGLNGGPHYKFTPAISLFVQCETQEEVDVLWSKLCEGGAEDRCGWLKDKYGLSWQIIPSVLTKLLYDPNPAKARNVVQAMLKMNKIDIKGLENAAAQIQ